MKKLTFILLLLLIFLVGCSSSTESGDIINPTLSPNGKEIENENTEEVLNSTTPSITEFNLKYEEVGSLVPLLEKNISDELKFMFSEKINDIEFLFYQSEEEVSLYLKLKDTTYEIGQIGYDPSVKEYPIENVDVSTQPFIKITGACGANCPISEYISLNSTIPTHIRIEAHTVEADVDADGINEIIATVGTAAETTLYKVKDDKVLTVNLNQILDAPVVIYDKEINIFQAEVIPGELSSWEIKDDKIQIIA